MKKLGLILSCTMLLSTACGRTPSTYSPNKLENIQVSTVESNVIADLGYLNGKTIAIKLLPPKESAFNTQAVIHRWVNNDIFQYDVILSKDGVDLTTVTVSPKAGQTGARFVHLKPQSLYNVRVLAKGNIGGTEAAQTINSQNPAAEDYDFRGDNDIEDTLANTIRVTLDNVDFDGSANVNITEQDSQYAGPSSVEGGSVVSLMVSTIAGNGQPISLDGSGLNASFYEPMGITADRQGNLYVSECGGHKIRKITPDGTVSTLAGNGGIGYQDGQGSQAMFYYPGCLATDNNSNVYVADGFNHCIRKITPDGTVSTLAGNGQSGFADGQGSEARFADPVGLAFENNALYVADVWNNRIRKIALDGTVTTIAGDGTPGLVNGQAMAAQFNHPVGLAIHNGTLYIGEHGNQCIRMITPNGIVSTLAGSGNPGYQDGNPKTAEFLYPGAVCFFQGSLYVSDGNHCIRRVSSDGYVSTIAGNVNNPGYQDGTGLTALFQGICSMTNIGNIMYVPDIGNHRIRTISLQ